MGVPCEVVRGVAYGGIAAGLRRHDSMGALRAKLISSMAVVTEAMYVLDESLPARRNLLTWIQRGGLTLIEPDDADFERIAALIEKYADLPMDFTDAVVVARCERLGIQHVASVDRDFGIYRYKGRGRFVNVFLK